MTKSPFFHLNPIFFPHSSLYNCFVVKQFPCGSDPAGQMLKGYLRRNLSVFQQGDCSLLFHALLETVHLFQSKNRTDRLQDPTITLGCTQTVDSM